ncbi:MAG: PEP-CTERM sorting domain-containing protein [Deltaproteobacteria bacterium]|nr:PEP-CTERM sorting domain-containing protein [Deltaproteobacteria bacterium]
MRKWSAGIALVGLLCASPAVAATYYYVDWTSSSPSAGTAAGTITLPDSSTVSVTFSVTEPNGAAGAYTFGQTNSGTNYWVPAAPYLSTQVDNSPPDSDILALTGGTSTTTYTITLSEPIRDPIMAIVSLGQPSVLVTYDFDRPFTIVSQGVGFWGGGPSALTQLPGDVLQGQEGHGTIQFIGTFSTFSWTAPTAEFWHGFTFGIRTTERIEPTPEPGALALLAAAGAALALSRRRTRT